MKRFGLESLGSFVCHRLERIKGSPAQFLIRKKLELQKDNKSQTSQKYTRICDFISRSPPVGRNKNVEGDGFPPRSRGKRNFPVGTVPIHKFTTLRLWWRSGGGRGGGKPHFVEINRFGGRI